MNNTSWCIIPELIRYGFNISREVIALGSKLMLFMQSNYTYGI